MSWFYESPHPIRLTLSRNYRIPFLNASNDLLSITQRLDESLRKFINRWQLATSKYLILETGMANHAFQLALRQGDFKYYLIPPPDYNEVMDLAIIHAKAEYKTYGDTPPPRVVTPSITPQDNPESRKREQEDTIETNKIAPIVNNRPEAKNTTPRFEVFSVINTTYTDILERHKDIIPLAPPARFPKPRNGKKIRTRCKYHKEDGHLTNDCRSLPNACLQMIHDGKLQDCIPTAPYNTPPVRSHIK
ncbi:hypothetical protein ACLB2K_002451 [Fragaria x ananassa]